MKKVNLTIKNLVFIVLVMTVLGIVEVSAGTRQRPFSDWLSAQASSFNPNNCASSVLGWLTPDFATFARADYSGKIGDCITVHGGPVSSHRAAWPGGAPLLTWLLSQGYAVWQPNPRGSSGRGLDVAGAVVGDMGGADAVDITSGVEALIADGTADPARIGVMGGSYGGFLSAWLITQSELFAAAVPMFPVTDWTQQHGISCIPGWDALFLAPGQDVDRSPLAHAAKARTPALFLAGALDRATPAGQALSMHRARGEW